MLRTVVPARVRRWLSEARWRYRLLRVRARQRTTEYPPDQTPDELRARLARAGLRLIPFQVRRADFERFVVRARYASRPYCAHGGDPNAREKYLEHFVSMELLGMGRGDVYIDVASDASPMPDIAAELIGARSFRQDWTYEDGVHGNRIGGDACTMPVPDAFASAMTLHCSFEHFEGDRDARFLREVERVLALGGRLCVLPLYLSGTYQIRTNPLLDLNGLAFDDAAVVCCRRDVFVRYARHYDVEHFMDRIVRNLGGLVLTLYEVMNARDIAAEAYLRYAMVLEKPAPAASVDQR